MLLSIRRTLPRGDGEIGAIKKSRQKITTRSRLEYKRQADALLAMEEDEEVLFKRPAASMDTPSGSRANSPDREEDEPKDYTAVLEMVKDRPGSVDGDGP